MDHLCMYALWQTQRCLAISGVLYSLLASWANTAYTLLLVILASALKRLSKIAHLVTRRSHSLIFYAEYSYFSISSAYLVEILGISNHCPIVNQGCMSHRYSKGKVHQFWFVNSVTFNS